MNILLRAGACVRLQGIHSNVDIRRVRFVLKTKPLLKRVFRDFPSWRYPLSSFAALAIANEHCKTIGRFEQPTDIGDRRHVGFGLVFRCGHGTTSCLWNTELHSNKSESGS